MSYDLPEDVNIDGVGAVILPFIAPIVYWRNGDQALENMEQIEGVQRFGGWAIQPDQIEPFQNSIEPLPSNFVLTKLSGKDGKFENYLARNISVAVIARRHAWFDKKSTTQYLAFMENFGAIILQTKSLGGKDLDTAVGNFKKLTAKVRFDESRNKIVSEQFFYAPLGTFGSVPKFENNENARGDKSAVTRVTVGLPQGGFTKDNIKFVGKDTAQEIVTIRRLSQEWLDDWNNRTTQKASLPPMPDTSIEFPFGNPEYDTAV